MADIDECYGNILSKLLNEKSFIFLILVGCFTTAFKRSRYSRLQVTMTFEAIL